MTTPKRRNSTNSSSTTPPSWLLGRAFKSAKEVASDELDGKNVTNPSMSKVRDPVPVLSHPLDSTNHDNNPRYSTGYDNFERPGHLRRRAVQRTASTDACSKPPQSTTPSRTLYNPTSPSPSRNRSNLFPPTPPQNEQHPKWAIQLATALASSVGINTRTESADVDVVEEEEYIRLLASSLEKEREKREKEKKMGVKRNKRKPSSPGFGSLFRFSPRPSSSSNPSNPSSQPPPHPRSCSLDNSTSRSRRNSARSSRSNSNENSKDPNADGVELSLFKMGYRNDPNEPYDVPSWQLDSTSSNTTRNSIYDSSGGIRAEPMYYEEVYNEGGDENEIEGPDEASGGRPSGGGGFKGRSASGRSASVPVKQNNYNFATEDKNTKLHKSVLMRTSSESDFFQGTWFEETSMTLKRVSSRLFDSDDDDSIKRGSRSTSTSPRPPGSPRNSLSPRNSHSPRNSLSPRNPYSPMNSTPRISTPRNSNSPPRSRTSDPPPSPDEYPRDLIFGESPPPSPPNPPQNAEVSRNVIRTSAPDPPSDRAEVPSGAGATSVPTPPVHQPDQPNLPSFNNTILRMHPQSAAAFLRAMSIFGFGGLLFQSHTLFWWISSLNSDLTISSLLLTLNVPSSDQILEYYVRWFWMLSVVLVGLLKLPFRIYTLNRLHDVQTQASRSNATNILKGILSSWSFTVHRLLGRVSQGLSIVGIIIYILRRSLDGVSEKAVLDVCCANLLVGVLRTLLAIGVLYTHEVRQRRRLQRLRSARQRRGLLEKEMEALHKETYKSRNNSNSSANPRESSSSRVQVCSICLERFKQGDKLWVLPCDDRHKFHGECIKSWLTKNSSCPLCTRNVRKDNLDADDMRLSERESIQL